MDHLLSKEKEPLGFPGVHGSSIFTRF